MADEDASNGSYVISAPGFENLSEAPQNDSSLLEINFSVSTDTTYYIYGRVNNSDSDNDAVWIRKNDGEYELVNNLITNGWQWLELKSYEFSAGNHSISLAIAKDSFLLDKIVVKSFQVSPVGLGEVANNICEPQIYISGVEIMNKNNGYKLEQNYPNPFTKSTSISFKIQKSTYISLTVFDIYGSKVAELAGKEYSPGTHTIEYNNEKLSAGNYFYTIQTEKFSATRKMVILGN